MADLVFEDEYLASLVDLVVDHAGQDFYLHLLMSEHSVLDVGCGTGALLHRARTQGHTGRLVGIDPASGVLARARSHEGIEWRQATLATAGFRNAFDLIVMTGHAFQVLLTDVDVTAFLAAARAALEPDGRLAFDAANPLVRPWSDWVPERSVEIRDGAGAAVRAWREVESVAGEQVDVTDRFAVGTEVRVSQSTIRFIHAERLDALLAAAGWVIHERYGSWDRRPFIPTSPEIITIAAIG